MVVYVNAYFCGKQNVFFMKNTPISFIQDVTYCFIHKVEKANKRVFPAAFRRIPANFMYRRQLGDGTKIKESRLDLWFSAN